jgi:hypothetical protein
MYCYVLTYNSPSLPSPFWFRRLRRLRERDINLLLTTDEAARRNILFSQVKFVVNDSVKNILNTIVIICWDIIEGVSAP